MIGRDPISVPVRTLADAPVRPRVLFVCQSNPWRLNNGGIIRNYWLVHALAQRFDVDLVTADESAGTVPPDFAARCAGIHRYPRPTGSRARIARAAGALRPNGSFFTSGNVTPDMRRGVARLLGARTYRAIVTELGLADALPRTTSVPIVYSSHNCEAALLLRRAGLEPPWARLAMTVDALRVRRLEKRLIDRALFAIPCSQNDVVDTAAFAPGFAGKSVVIPNGVDCASYAHVSSAPGEPGLILITGSYDWLPNRRGLLWFLKEVLPALEGLMGDAAFRVRVAGRMTPEFAQRLNEIAHVTAVPNVPRMDVELRAASVVAVPVIASSGTRLRILEAWAAGRPIVTTSHGAFGLNFTDGNDLFARSEPSEFAQALALLLGDAAARARLRAAGLTQAASYDWSVVGAKLLAAFERFGVLPATAADHIPAS